MKIILTELHRIFYVVYEKDKGKNRNGDGRRGTPANVSKPNIRCYAASGVSFRLESISLLSKWIWYLDRVSSKKL